MIKFLFVGDVGFIFISILFKIILKDVCVRFIVLVIYYLNQMTLIYKIQDKLRLPSSTDIYLLTEFIGKNEAGEKCLLD